MATTNDTRATTANAILAAYSDDAETSLRDLLADLMHFATAYGYDFDHELAVARENHRAES